MLCQRIQEFHKPGRNALYVFMTKDQLVTSLSPVVPAGLGVEALPNFKISPCLLNSDNY